VGDVVVAVNGEDVCDLDHEDVLQKIIVSDRRLCAVFLYCTHKIPPVRPTVAHTRCVVDEQEAPPVLVISFVTQPTSPSHAHASTMKQCAETALSPASEAHASDYGKRLALVSARHAQGLAVAVLYTSSTKSNLKMESDERRTMSLLGAKSVAYEIVYVDIELGRQSELDPSAPLPQLHANGVFLGDFNTLQELEDLGSLEQILADVC
jgi:hypothetical protein